MSIEDQRRAAFEAYWLGIEPHATALLKRTQGVNRADVYANTHVQACWQGWNAALDSVVIELPGSFMPGEAQHPCIEVPDIIEAIESAGLKVKP